VDEHIRVACGRGEDADFRTGAKKPCVAALQGIVTSAFTALQEPWISLHPKWLNEF
jgi:hypothetical protein